MAAIFDTDTTSRSSDRAAGGLDRAGAVAADQAEQPVDGAHPGPGQRVVQQPLGVDPDVRPVPGADRDQPGQVPQRVAGLVLGQVVAVGGPATGRLPGMGLDQPATRQ